MLPRSRGMAELVKPPASASAPPRRGVNRRTLETIRWIAICGQILAVVIVSGAMGFSLPLLPIAITIGAAIAVNAVSAVSVGNRGLSPARLGLHLGFDILQLATLLYFTGGLQNPFVIFLLAPVAVAAAILPRRSIAALVILVLICAGLLAVYHRPLPWPEPGFDQPVLYLIGIWTALSLTSLFLVPYIWSVVNQSRRMQDALNESRLALARQQQASALGALAAAAAHELGNPLGTIALVVKEMRRDLPPGSPQEADLDLLQSQTERCREILTEISRNPASERDGPFEVMQLPALLEVIAAPYRRDGITFSIEQKPPKGRADSAAGAAANQEPPELRRSPEVMHGIGNIVQNAMQFAYSKVQALIEWDDSRVSVYIIDDGPGFSTAVLDRLGEPYLSQRSEKSRRGNGTHLGLGVFIAQTLLERIGGRLHFANRSEGGAEVRIIWQRGDLLAASQAQKTM